MAITFSVFTVNYQGPNTSFEVTRLILNQNFIIFPNSETFVIDCTTLWTAKEANVSQMWRVAPKFILVQAATRPTETNPAVKGKDGCAWWAELTVDFSTTSAARVCRMRWQVTPVQYIFHIVLACPGSSDPSTHAHIIVLKISRDLVLCSWSSWCVASAYKYPTGIGSKHRKKT